MRLPDDVLAGHEHVLLAWMKRHVTEAGARWMDPLVTRCASSYGTYEWWCDTHKLTVDLEHDGTVSWTCVWGPDMNTEMDDDKLDISKPAEFVDLWWWLIEDNEEGYEEDDE